MQKYFLNLYLNCTVYIQYIFQIGESGGGRMREGKEGEGGGGGGRGREGGGKGEAHGSAVYFIFDLAVNRNCCNCCSILH